MKQVLALLVAFVVLAPATVSAKENWTVTKDDVHGGAALSAMPDMSESDTDLWVMCRKDGRFTVGIGANDGVGTGKGEAVSVTLTSAGKSAMVKGVSKNSSNFEMTGGTELVATVSKDDPLFAVLATAKPIQAKNIGTPPKAETWGVTGLAKKLPPFLASCVKK